LWHKRDTFEFLCVEALNKKLNILDTLQVDSTAKFIINNDFFDTETNQFILNEDSNDIKNLSAWLAKDSLYTIEISTHIFTDENSSKTYLNSKLRNDAFTNYLLQNGVSPKQIKNKIYTNQQPIITLKNQYYNDFNTRLQLRFLYSGDKYRTKIQMKTLN
jgi:outer membrane protein OmpA-like peptidoglycan-associated protein